MSDSSKSWELSKQVTKPIKHLKKGNDLAWVWEEKGLELPKVNLWVVTEKVHGANLAMKFERGGVLRCAKRKEFLEKEINSLDGRKFWNHTGREFPGCLMN
jgi:hypothetical protein